MEDTTRFSGIGTALHSHQHPTGKDWRTGNCSQPGERTTQQDTSSRRHQPYTGQRLLDLDPDCGQQQGLPVTIGKKSKSLKVRKIMASHNFNVCTQPFGQFPLNGPKKTRSRSIFDDILVS